jgi:HSP20 family protein
VQPGKGKYLLEFHFVAPTTELSTIINEGLQMSLINMPAHNFDDFYRPFNGLLSQGFPSRLHAETEAWMPSVDIRREDNAFVIEMEIPGFAPEEIDVEAHDNVLTIQGERNEETTEESKDDYIRRERRYGKFVRRFSLPPGAATDDIGAQVKDGVLHVRVPNGATDTPKKIAVD